jgi:DNA-binding SARP family transcriptional activator
VDLGPATRVSLLGGFTVEVGHPRYGDVLPELPLTVQRLLARLSLAGQAPRALLAGQLWPDVTESHAHGSLRAALWRVQQALPGVVQASARSLALASGVRVDVQDLVCWARRVTDPQTAMAEMAAPEAALRGELLPGWYDDWILLEREQLRQLRMHALEALAERLGAVGRFGDAVQAALAAVRAEPLRESAHRVVVRLHLAEGNLAEARRAYEAYRALLADELGVEPTALMQQLAARIPAAGRSPGPPGGG